MQFNLQDDDEGYERTDEFIEKTVKLAFELIRRRRLIPRSISGSFFSAGQLERKGDRAGANYIEPGGSNRGVGGDRRAGGDELPQALRTEDGYG